MLLLQHRFASTLALSAAKIIVTGASSGLGRECVRQLAALPGLSIILACRDTAAGEAAVKAITEEHPGADLEVEVIKPTA